MIEREKVIEGFKRCMKYDCTGCPYKHDERATPEEYYYCDDVLNHDVLDLLTETPDIVRCKDCKHYVKEKGECIGTELYIPSGNWFCAAGERK